MRIQDLSGKKVCILGFGKEGRAMFQAIEQYAPDAHVTVADKNPDTMNELVTKLENGIPFKYKRGFTMHSGDKTWLRELETFDVIIKSPGIPPQPEFAAVKDRMTTPTNIFLDLLDGTGAFVIGVTGSKGKSTTSSLIYAILKAAGKDVYLCGNIGIPAIEYVDRAKKGAIFVLEMSSYQLMDCTRSPQIAVVTSFFPEHLDYHGNLEAYLEAKKHIARFQKPDDVVLFAEGFNGTVEIAKEGQGRKIPFSAADAPLRLEETHLLGAHNLSNIAGAVKACELVGVSEKAAIAAIKEFHGLPHRLQSLGVHHGIEWVDDAISTTPESAVAAMEALGDRVKTVILGGQDRGLDFTTLGRYVATSSVKTVILFPETGERIRQAIADAHADVCFLPVSSMEEAVEATKKHTPERAICLLSTASPSYNMFKNFEEKGEMFRQCILS